MCPYDWGHIGMFGAFFDESTDTNTAIVYATAGWFASDSQWERFNECWSDILIEYEIDEFKARDCEAGDNAFRGWLPSERDDVRERLIKVITDCELSGIATAINLKEASPLVAEPQH